MKRVKKAENIRECAFGITENKETSKCTDDVKWEEFDCDKIADENIAVTPYDVCYYDTVIVNQLIKGKLFEDPVYPEHKLADNIEDINTYRRLFPNYDQKFIEIMSPLLGQRLHNLILELSTRKIFSLLRTISYVYLDVGIWALINVSKIIDTFDEESTKEILKTSSFYRNLLLTQNTFDDTVLMTTIQCQYQLLIQTERHKFFENEDFASLRKEFIRLNGDYYLKLLNNKYPDISKSNLLTKLKEYEDSKQPIYDILNSRLLTNKALYYSPLILEYSQNVLTSECSSFFRKLLTKPETDLEKILSAHLLRHEDIVGCVKGLGSKILNNCYRFKDLCTNFNININIEPLSQDEFTDLINRYIFTNTSQSSNASSFHKKYLKYKQKYLSLKNKLN